MREDELRSVRVAAAREARRAKGEAAAGSEGMEQARSRLLPQHNVAWTFGDTDGTLVY